MQAIILSRRVFFLSLFLFNLFFSPIIYAWDRNSLNEKIISYRKDISTRFKTWKSENKEGLKRIKEGRAMGLIREKKNLESRLNNISSADELGSSIFNIKSRVKVLIKQDLAYQNYYKRKFLVLKEFFEGKLKHYERFTKTNIELYNDVLPDFFPLRKKAILIFSSESRVKQTWLKNKFCYEQKFYKKQKAYQDYKLSLQKTIIPIKIDLALFESKKIILERNHKSLKTKLDLFERFSHTIKTIDSNFDNVSSSIRELHIDEVQLREKVLAVQKKYHQVKLDLKLAKSDIAQERKLRKSIIFCNPSRDILKLASPISYQIELRQVSIREPANF